MNYIQLIEDLEEIVRQLGITLRYEKGDFEGGYCILKDQKTLMVNKRLHEVRRASMLALALTEIGTESIFIKPAVRAYIEDEAAKLLKQK
jgi:hypothetical protein